MPIVRRRTIVGSSALAVALVVFLVVPVVQYSVAFSDPGLYNVQALAACGTETNSSAWQTCAASARLPPTTIEGRAPPAYYLLGVGIGPYPQTMIASQGGSAFLLHLQGSSITYIEPYLDLPSNATLDPQGVVKVDNVSISQWAFGFLNFSARITNVGSKTLWNLVVSFNYPSFGLNGTLGGIRSYTAVRVQCATELAPSESCLGSTLLAETTSLLTDQFYPMILEVSCAKTSPGPSTPFVYTDTLSLRYPGVGLNSQWVKSFIAEVNLRRNGTALTENRTLDEFAAFRYDTLRAQYQISDYNFTVDYHRYFGFTGPAVLEEILYPNGRDPTAYPGYLQKNAPGHYAGLVDTAYTKYGYFFGTGPSVDIGPGCPATEIPGPDINITKFVISQGCSYVIADEIWFILILSY